MIMKQFLKMIKNGDKIHLWHEKVHEVYDAKYEYIYSIDTIKGKQLDDSIMDNQLHFVSIC